MNKWTVISNDLTENTEQVLFDPNGMGTYYQWNGEEINPVGFHYEMRRGLAQVSFEDEWETSGGVIPILGGKLLLFRVRENYFGKGEWFSDSLVLSPLNPQTGIRFLSRFRASEIQTRSLWLDRHDGNAVRAAIEATGFTQEACSKHLRVSVSTFRTWLKKANWDANKLAQMGFLLDTDLIGPYLSGYEGRVWIATPDGNGLLRYKLDWEEENDGQ